MEGLKIDRKENILNSYSPTPTLPFDVEGILVEKKGRDIKLEKTMDHKTVLYSLRVKEDVEGLVGDQVRIEKENIVSAKLEEKDQDKEKAEVHNDLRKAEDIVKDLGLEDSEENIRAVDFLNKNSIAATEENILSYLKSKEYLEDIIQELDIDSYTKLLERGLDFEDESLQKIAESLDEIKGKGSFSLRRFLRIERDLNYREAEQIGREIYGRKMGKDVYDAIIALHREKLPINKENISNILDNLSKISRLKDIEDQTYIDIIRDDKVFSVNNLFKANNYYRRGSLESNGRARDFEAFTILEDTNLDSLKKILLDLDLEGNRDNINILREFIVNDMPMDRAQYDRVMLMKSAVGQLMSLITEESTARLHREGIDLLEEDIHRIVEELKSEDKPVHEKEGSKNTREDFMGDLEGLGRIKDRDLLLLIKNQEDFNLKNLREIIDTNMKGSLNQDHKTLDKVIHISNIFNSLGENLNPSLVHFTMERYNSISLENLHISSQELRTMENPIKAVEATEEGTIFEEYHRVRNDLTIMMVKESIKENKEIESLALDELNKYIEKKLNKYSQSQRLVDEIRSLSGSEERILPAILKNQLPMTMKEIREINEAFDFLNNPQGQSQGREGRKREKKYIEIEKTAKGKDLQLQLPMKIDGEDKYVNLMVANVEEGIEKEDMNFYLDLETKNLGKVSMEIRVQGKEVQLDLVQGSRLDENLKLLEEGLAGLGYRLARR
ncbi:MAG: DUF6240 domain-containing protein [Tissierellaceae bacterium]